MAKGEALAELRRRGGELVQLCASLVQIPSENPPGDTSRIAAYVREYLEERGIPTHTYEPRQGQQSVLATLGRGRPNLVLSGHLDTFPAGEGWSFPPFSGGLRDGRILGRGAGDMKGGLAVALCAASLIRDMGVDLQGSLTLALVADEETGGTWGTQWLLEHVPAVRGDACLIGESSGAWAIGVGEKGVLWVRIKVAGISGHAAYAQGDSAIGKMLAVLDVIAALHGVTARPADAIATLIRRQRPLAEERWAPGTGALADRLTVNIGTLRGGGQVNLIPSACEAEIDLRLPPGMTAADVEEEVRQRIDHLGLQGIEIAVVNRCDPYVTPPEERLVRLIRAHALTICGREALPVVRLGYTDGRFFRREGIPTAIYGPGVHNMGGPDESVAADELLAVAGVHTCAILDYLGEGACHA